MFGALSSIEYENPSRLSVKNTALRRFYVAVLKKFVKGAVYR